MNNINEVELMQDKSLAGKYKTSVMKQRIIDTCTERYIAFSPTMVLSSEYSSAGMQVIHSGIGAGNKYVIDAVIEAIIDEDNNISTTHSTYTSLMKCVATNNDSSPLRTNLSSSNIVIDEALGASIKSFTITDSGLVNLLSLFKVTPYSKPGVYEVTPANDEAEKQIRLMLSIPKKDRANHAISSAGFELMQFVLDPTYIQLVGTNEWDKATTTISNGSLATTATVTIAALFDASIFDYHKSVQFLCTDWGKTELGVAIEYQGITPTDNSVCLDTAHDNDNIIIHYYTDKNWSEKLRNLTDKAGVTNSEKIAQHAKNYIGGNEFIWNANVTDRAKLSKIFQRAPTTEIAGVNCHRHKHYAVHLSSAKLNQAEKSCYNDIGLSALKIEFAREKLAKYQFMMRTAARTNSTESIHWFITDKASATFLQSYFPISKVILHDVGLEYGSKKTNGTPKGIRLETWNKYLEAVYYMEEGLTQKLACDWAGLGVKAFRRCKKTN